MPLFDDDRQTQESVADEIFEGAVLREAFEEGLIDENGNDLMVLHEKRARKSPNMAPELKKIKLSKSQKMQRLQNRTAILLARKSSDPEFARYKAFLDKAKVAREKIYGKYSSKAKAAASASLRGSGKRAKDSPSGTVRT